jgi:hypothetical protein
MWSERRVPAVVSVTALRDAQGRRWASLPPTRGEQHRNSGIRWIFNLYGKKRRRVRKILSRQGTLAKRRALEVSDVGLKQQWEEIAIEWHNHLCLAADQPKRDAYRGEGREDWCCTAPSRQMPMRAIRYSELLPISVATRSPGPTPRRASAAATLSDSLRKSPYVISAASRSVPTTLYAKALGG